MTEKPKVISSRRAVELIHDVLNGPEWDAGTIEQVAEIVEMTGLEILPPG